MKPESFQRLMFVVSMIQLAVLIFGMVCSVRVLILHRALAKLYQERDKALMDGLTEMEARVRWLERRP